MILFSDTIETHFTAFTNTMGDRDNNTYLHRLAEYYKILVDLRKVSTALLTVEIYTEKHLTVITRSLMTAVTKFDGITTL